MRTLTALLTLSIAWCVVVSGCSVRFGGGDRNQDATVDKDGENQEAGTLCGNQTADSGEDCDGDDLGGQTCRSRGHAGGTLGCTAQCRYDESGCVDQLCGNGECELTDGENTDNCPEDCGWLTVSCGENHTCALKNDGTAWCWGRNGRGQLGDSTTDEKHEPSAVVNLSGVAVISAWRQTTCAVTASGVALCWGSNDSGQLGIGTVTTNPTPTPQQVIDPYDSP